MRDFEQSGAILAGLPSYRLGMAAAVTLIFAVIARLVRGVTISGAIAGSAVCFVLYAAAGPGGILALATVFVLAWTTTRLGRQRKQILGTAEKQEGRKASQVVANLGIAAICAAIYWVNHGNAAWLVAASAALSEAAGDTVSSELGQAGGRSPRLITTGKRVQAGTDGGVTWLGTLGGLGAAGLVSLVCIIARLIPPRLFGLSVLAAIIGMLTDSFLGAWLQRRGWLNNDAVNFLSTAVAALAAILLR